MHSSPSRMPRAGRQSHGQLNASSCQLRARTARAAAPATAPSGAAVSRPSGQAHRCPLAALLFAALPVSDAACAFAGGTATAPAAACGPGGEAGGRGRMATAPLQCAAATPAAASAAGGEAGGRGRVAVATSKCTTAAPGPAAGSDGGAGGSGRVAPPRTHTAFILCTCTVQWVGHSANMREGSSALQLEEAHTCQPQCQEVSKRPQLARQQPWA